MTKLKLCADECGPEIPLLPAFLTLASSPIASVQGKFIPLSGNLPILTLTAIMLMGRKISKN